MGGYGSGRYLRLAVKNSRHVNQFSTVDIRQVRKERGLSANTPARLAFFYTLRGRRVSVSAPVVWVPYPYGLRPFFECPRCARRCCLLYLAEVCACRQCLGLSYPVQFETKQNQVLRRAWKARERLAQPDGRSVCGDPIPDWKKPKGMHWTTFNRLRDEAQQAAVELWGGPIGQGLLERQAWDRKNPVIR